MAFLRFPPKTFAGPLLLIEGRARSFFGAAEGEPFPHRKRSRARMGGLFRAPKPVVVAPPSAPATTTTTTDPAQAAEETAAAARAEVRARNTRGLPGTIATSARGLLGARSDFTTTRKSLLGE